MILRPRWPEPVSIRRRIAVATWRPSKDGRIYTRMEVDATHVLAYVQRVRDCTGERVTVTHVVGAALGRALRSMPEIRARVVLGRIVPLGTCDIGFAVDVAGGKDLAPIKVHRADELSPVEIARALSTGAGRLRKGEDEAYSRSSRIVDLAPTWALRPLVSVLSTLTGGFGVGALGQPGFPLGTAFVSNVGSLGLDEAFMAPLPFARAPLYLAIGAVRDAPAVVDERVVVRPQMVLVATADHRLVDGAHAGKMAQVLRELLAEPDRLDH